MQFGLSSFVELEWFSILVSVIELNSNQKNFLYNYMLPFYDTPPP